MALWSLFPIALLAIFVVLYIAFDGGQRPIEEQILMRNIPKMPQDAATLAKAMIQGASSKSKHKMISARDPALSGVRNVEQAARDITLHSGISVQVMRGIDGTPFLSFKHVNDTSNTRS